MSTPTLITLPNATLAPFYTFLRSAKASIDMTMYELADTTAQQILAEEVAAGVTVRVILDQNRERTNNTAAFTFLQQAGVQVVWANPTYAATHQKTITVDRTTSAIMTLNLTASTTAPPATSPSSPPTPPPSPQSKPPSKPTSLPLPSPRPPPPTSSGAPPTPPPPWSI